VRERRHQIKLNCSGFYCYDALNWDTPCINKKYVPYHVYQFSTHTKIGSNLKINLLRNMQIQIFFEEGKIWLLGRTNLRQYLGSTNMYELFYDNNKNRVSSTSSFSFQILAYSSLEYLRVYFFTFKLCERHQLQ